MSHGPGNSMNKVEKPKDFKTSFKRLLGYLKPYRLNLIIVFIFAILSTLFTIVSPKILGEATTLIFKGVMSPERHVDYEAVGTIVIWLIALYLLSSIFSFVQQYIMSSVAQNTVYDMRKQLKEKMDRLPLNYYDQRNNGDLLSRAVNDMDNIANTLQQSLTTAITSIVTIIGITIMMFTINFNLTLIVLLTVPLSLIVVIFVAKKSQSAFKSQQKELGLLNNHIEEMYSGHQLVKAFQREDESLTVFNEGNEKYFKAARRAQFISGLIMPLMRFVGNLGYVGVALVGGFYALNGRINVGDIQAFIQYSRQFNQPFADVGNIANIIQSTIASAERVFEMLDEPDEIDTRATVPAVYTPKYADAVAFENVAFGYNGKELLMENLDFTVNKGQTVAIVGPTGAGKTTIINLLMRFYDVNKGHIFIDGYDIQSQTREEIRAKFGMVLQDTWLFKGTIRENIRYSNNDADDETIVEAAKAAYADDFIRKLPEGYDTVLDEDGNNISQGQKQLLTIARAIIANRDMLVLDEATSSVDTRTEVNLQKAMDNLRSGRTSFVIAHRLSTIRDADLILVMKEGDVIERGNHQELIEQKGFYADLYNSQFGVTE
ncbi:MULTISPECIES: ABC transporter ATP-binding protein [Brochothrix]|uniref:ABC transporter ATP-binding protein n=1 Tax=Brochothrix thermosphacta TaxID=2756 RepID=A0A1D2L2S1_BROTH|nr:MULTISPECIES: ABC transporter ATP-binding protein [Brochothrix]SLM91243.1 Lipid A export ATP-binding/permease protein MsbA [Brachybacterium faecium]ANZ95562.1 ABC transporter [Brochothrix thermosphacta]ANZ98389.1 ABC transporter [Brochothrix thermosphacta]ATF25588.1 ABC transporter ATP-binding protein [Brochothrix thermosphacta]ATH84922.1 ABC transporter ATP-binding protein [Brochothrix thermosphacta]